MYKVMKASVVPRTAGIWLICAIVLVTIASCGSKSGQRTNRSIMRTVQEMRLATDSTLVSMPGYSMLRLDSLYHVNDTVLANGTAYRIIR